MLENPRVTNGNHAKRCTILIDDCVYIKSKKAALDRGLKLYEYINNILADAVKLEIPYVVKHPSVRKKRKTERVNMSEVSGGQL